MRYFTNHFHSARHQEKVWGSGEVLRLMGILRSVVVSSEVIQAAVAYFACLTALHGSYLGRPYMVGEVCVGHVRTSDELKQKNRHE